MIALIEDNREAIVALCKQYGVQRLAVFGPPPTARSALRPANSILPSTSEIMSQALCAAWWTSSLRLKPCSPTQSTL